MNARGGDESELLLEKSRGLPHGSARIALVEEAVRHADARNDLPTGFRCRLELVSAASSGGQPELKLVAFAWCLSQFDRNPGLFGGRATEYELLWKYKWVAGALPSFHQISREQISATMEDLRRRYRADGSTMHAVYDEEVSIAISLGDKPQAAEAFRKLQSTPRDQFSNCPACVEDRLVSYHRFFDRHEEAIDAAGPILAGRLKCSTVPHRTYPKLMNSLFRLGRTAEAMHYHRVGYPMVASNPGHTAYVDDHIRFLAFTDNLTRALRLTQKHLLTALGYASLNTRYAFLRDVRLLFHFLKQHGVKKVSLPLPGDHPFANESGRVGVSEFLDWLDADTHRVGAFYDARNGNDVFLSGLKSDAANSVKQQPFPFRKLAERKAEG